MKIEFSLQIFKDTIIFDDDPSDARRVVPCGRIDGQMDKHDEANSLFANLRTRPKAALASTFRVVPDTNQVQNGSFTYTSPHRMLRDN
jgi:hypothetical protein